MTVHKWRDIRRPAPPEAAARIAAEMEAELLQLNLQELRNRRGVTQQELAAAMGTHQAGLSRAERQEDHLVSTLKAYVEALGGRLELRAVFNDGQAIEVNRRVNLAEKVTRKLGADKSVVGLVLDSIGFSEGILGELEKYHHAIRAEPEDLDGYGRYLLIAGTLHHLRSSSLLLKQGRTLSAMALLRPAGECVEVCWYLSRKGTDGWKDWARGKGNYNYKVISKEMANAGQSGFDHQVHGTLNRSYDEESKFVHPTKNKLETLLARHPDEGYVFEPGLLEDKQTAAAVLVMMGQLAIILSVVGILYKDDWPTTQAQEIGKRMDYLRSEFNSRLGPNTF